MNYLLVKVYSFLLKILWQVFAKGTYVPFSLLEFYQQINNENTTKAKRMKVLHLLGS